MKTIKFLMKPALFFAGIVLMVSCSGNKEEKSPVKVQPVAAEKKTGPFAFYKDISVKPGLNFEVLSWGKGVDSIGGYLILMSDSVRNNYNSFSNERKGIITDAWNMDMDNDGNPEIYIELLSKKNVLDLNVYEYAGGEFRKITFPPLSSNMKKNYAGNDKFIIKNGDLFRSFPVVNPKDTTIKQGEMKMIQYQLNGNSFSVNEVKQE
ncbi:MULTISPECIES: hypothetical protein [Pedobacter]|uniref:Lipoprotein n=1 Tax=Pedobacter heparinus (strain ATCC 13125 / DSM 2366 / CIP 104194 / JCM 7457 / NBRC 12017 / NCIMB 9290 / NRRL B-14731 / HIM 762-3) TaxID=485917 RepID=C6XUH8_PEDHD|nr:MULTISPECIES: hypothetical protein [Pedobacter]ACU03828.1 hypothetical protein Phep_1615 [Pedobacter heparinus DSM 2366]MBB5436650.1 hypothetical protein [Pedobacter sp. AK017]